MMDSHASLICGDCSAGAPATRWSSRYRFSSLDRTWYTISVHCRSRGKMTFQKFWPCWYSGSSIDRVETWSCIAVVVVLLPGRSFDCFLGTSSLEVPLSSRGISTRFGFFLSFASCFNRSPPSFAESSAVSSWLLSPFPFSFGAFSFCRRNLSKAVGFFSFAFFLFFSCFFVVRSTCRISALVVP